MNPPRAQQQLIHRALTALLSSRLGSFMSHRIFDAMWHWSRTKTAYHILQTRSPSYIQHKHTQMPGQRHQSLMPVNIAQVELRVRTHIWCRCATKLLQMGNYNYPFNPSENVYICVCLCVHMWSVTIRATAAASTCYSSSFIFFFCFLFCSFLPAISLTGFLFI